MPAPVPGQLPPGLLMLSQYQAANEPEEEQIAHNLINPDVADINAANAQEAADAKNVLPTEEAAWAAANDTPASSTGPYIQLPSTGPAGATPSYTGYGQNGKDVPTNYYGPTAPSSFVNGVAYNAQGQVMPVLGSLVNPQTGQIDGNVYDSQTGAQIPGETANINWGQPGEASTPGQYDEGSQLGVGEGEYVPATSTPAVNVPYNPDAPLTGADQQIADTDQANAQAAYTQYSGLQSGNAAGQIGDQLNVGAQYTQGDQNLDNALFQGSQANINKPAEAFDPNAFNEDLASDYTGQELAQDKTSGPLSLHNDPGINYDLPPGSTPSGGATPEKLPAPDDTPSPIDTNPHSYKQFGSTPEPIPTGPSQPTLPPGVTNTGKPLPPGSHVYPYTGPIQTDPTPAPVTPPPNPTSSTGSAPFAGALSSATNTSSPAATEKSTSAVGDPNAGQTANDLIVGNNNSPVPDQFASSGAGNVADIPSEDEDGKDKSQQTPVYMSWS